MPVKLKKTMKVPTGAFDVQRHDKTVMLTLMRAAIEDSDAYLAVKIDGQTRWIKRTSVEVLEFGAAVVKLRMATKAARRRGLVK